MSDDAATVHPNALGVTKDIRTFDLLGFRKVLTPINPKVNVIGANHHARFFLPPEKGHKYVTQSNPTPDFLKSILESMKEPSLLLLRGCDQFLLPTHHFPSEKFKTLTSLEISGVSHLTTLPKQAFSQMTGLQILTLSHLIIQQFPEDFFSNLTNLRSLAIRGCSYLQCLPVFPKMDALESLDLSHLLIETIPEGFFSGLQNLRWLSLKGCSKLSHLSSEDLRLVYLEVLDLSHCTALHKDHGFHGNLKILDLSYTTFRHIPSVYEYQLFTHLFLRDVKVTKLEFLSLVFVEVLDLSGAQNVKDLGCLDQCEELRALDLSGTRIESIDFISRNKLLCHLILRECVGLVRLPVMGELTRLQLLDISGCELLADLPEDLSNLKNLKELNLSGCGRLGELREGLFDQMSCLEKLDLSKTRLNRLPSFANLTNLQTLNVQLSEITQVPDLCNLNLREFFCADCPKLKGVPAGLQAPGDLDLAPFRSGEIDLDLQGRISESSTFHLVSTFFSDSGFDRFKQGFTELVEFISSIRENLEPNTLPVDATNVVPCEITTQTSHGKLTSILVDLKYIQDRIDLLESSRNGTIAVELLNDLMKASKERSPVDFPPDSPNLSQLHRTVVKLKLLVPPPPPPMQVEENEERNKKEKFTSRSRDKDMEEDFFRGRDKDTEEAQQLSISYNSLMEIQRKCLLYFSVIPHGKNSLMMKKRTLIQLWYGEGLIGPQHEESVSLSNDNSIENPQSTPNQNQNLDPTAYSDPNPDTIEEIGTKILMALQEKGFITIYERQNHLFYNNILMDDSKLSFVRERAKAERLFCFDDKNGKLTQGKSAYLISTTTRIASSSLHPFSCELWPSYTNSSENLASFKTIGTLFNGDEPIVNIRAEWFSQMRNLKVLHLERADDDYENLKPIEVVDLKFLEELKNMKQLRLLSLAGFSTITKLPESVCKLPNLKIINLRDCSYLEKIPVDIGSLKNLTHLDLTNCHIISKLPKEVGLLSKLEVLKGFVISYQVGGRQSRDACTLRELLNLEKLRKLSLVVNTKNFPNSTDIQIIKKMKNLCDLKITWEKNYTEDQETQDVDVDVGSEALRWYSRWQQLKCWEVQTRQSETEEMLRSKHSDKLEKLVMCCFPLDTKPNWLHPSVFPKLEKLYIVGGQLTTLAVEERLTTLDTYQNTWNVKILCLKYLQNLDMDWEELRNIFSNMSYFTEKECVLIRNCPTHPTEIEDVFYWDENEDGLTMN